MEETREINALLHLIDDPDKEVFTTVSDKIVSFGKPIIANLEHLWETTPDEGVQERIELLIHRLHFRELSSEFKEWKTQGEQELLSGSLLVSRFQYPDIAIPPIITEVEKMRRNIWLELNSYLTSLEKTNVLTTILYNYYHVKGVETLYSEPNDFLVHKVLENKRGNAIANGILYLSLCEMLGISIKAINIPRQFILAYFNDEPDDTTDDNPAHYIQFYIDPLSGQIFTHKDVEVYFKRISVPPTASYFKPLDNKRIIQFLLEEFSKCFDDEKNRYKVKELPNPG
ncbi:MAG: hypothetical protein H7Y03_10135, partial [Chitinophagaceae bacterium]|nr:hypothetical protein [Chitinophagaceae bacterium]